MSHHKTARSEQDEAWKTVLTSHFQHFMHLLFSSIAQRIDWALIPAAYRRGNS